ncbi:hypothetical protein LTR62_003350 [Meristemomyces frigidus]|uniref:Ribosome assembly protein 3 n=1 Tax=Meristemomyces frigidus TaxID=1508187 RepID=A0AAN7TL39_9PEZI|nr:hypothetical protein LTR62_003350 [Meristemomyces frigidus]
MAAKSGAPKRKNKRKVRTEIASSASGSSRASSPALQTKEADNNTIDHADQTTTPAAGTEEQEEENTSQRFPERPTPNPEKAFSDFYLRQATKEFANDLDKLRSASDFGAKSVGLLVGALGQGGACFGKGERERVGRGV